MVELCPFGKVFDPDHKTCASCTINCTWKAKRKPTVSKYGNKKVTVDGHRFDSKREAARYQELKMMERAGLISDIKRQERFELIPKQKGERPAFYTADFTYTNKDGETIVEDVKSQPTRTTDYVLRRKLMLQVHGVRIVEV